MAKGRPAVNAALRSIGAHVVLSLEKFRPVHGVVRWCQDGLAGIAFNQVIPFHELMGWLRAD